jgi:chorismate lyase/3-hydroxybenzoate synthase
MSSGSLSPTSNPAVDLTYVRAADAPGSHTIAFGDALPGAIHVPVRQLGPEPLVEAITTNDLMFFGVTTPETAPREEISRTTYLGHIERARRSGYPYFVRMWNFVGSINEIEERERYQLFCAGRHDAFVEAGYHHDVDLPAASAVGMPGRGLITYFLAAREPGVQVENPRQVAAYNYPPQYGPKTPSFSRATVWGDTVFVSGTSSVVGHATVHTGDVRAQVEETLRNIEAVLARTGRTLNDVTAAKTYVRHATDYNTIAARLADVFPVNLYLEADICRKDLLLEIECVAR